MAIDPRFFQEAGEQVYTGAELIIKGALEAKVGFISGYPGSPIADVFNTARNISDLLKERGILVQLASNEALSAARLNGTQMADIRALIAMKSVGAHVASDGLALGNLSKTSHHGGALVVVGDDPWSESTQVPTDSRYLSKHLHIPVMEPATFQELKDWVNTGLELSRKANLYLVYLVTTNLADGGGTVRVHPNQYPYINTNHRVTIDTKSIPVEETVILSPRTADREETLQSRYDLLLEEARKQGVNRIVRKSILESGSPSSAKRKPIGFISAGLSYSYLEQALETFYLTEQIPILKFGISFPIDSELLLEFAKSVDNLVVVEEKRDFLESQVVSSLRDAFQRGQLDRSVPVWGKKFPGELKGISPTRGLNQSILIERLGLLFLTYYTESLYFEPEDMKKELDLIRDTAESHCDLIKRTPTFCPGCPHRDSSSALLEIRRKFRDAAYMKERFGREPVDLVFHGDTGCYTMLMFEPNQELMHNYSGMGLGGGTGAGINPFITNKQVVFMGDSTFFHSGMIAISDAIKHNQDITFVILDNGTIAMTGHQPTPGQELDLMGNETVAQNIEKIVLGMTGETGIPVHRSDPSLRERYQNLLQETILKDGVKIIIADKECGITYDRKIVLEEQKILRKHGFLPQKRYINLSTDVCEFCLECTKATGCPGLTIINTPFGKKLETDLSWCKSDSACAKIDACPSFEEIIVKRSRKPQTPVEKLEPMSLPVAKRAEFDRQWSAYIAGIGGMGIGVITAILVQAGMREGYRVRFVDKKGLAIRNGGVYSHIHFFNEDKLVTPITHYGKTDLLLGLDILEAVRSIDSQANIRVTHPDRTIALVNTHKTPTIMTLTGKEDFDIAALERIIQSRTKKGTYYGVDLSHISQHFLGNKLFANLMMLGIAYQRNLLPVSLENLRYGIERSVRVGALKENWSAFELGRRLVIKPGDFQSKKIKTYASVLEEKTELLVRRSWFGFRTALVYRRLVQEAVKSLRLDDETNKHLALRIYELIQYDNVRLAKSYVQKIQEVYQKDSPRFDFLATKTVIRYLFKVLAIKDEMYVAYLLTNEEKRRRDYERYNIDPQRGDRIVYRHFNQPEFSVLFGTKIRFHIKTKDWQLQIMRHLKWLRLITPLWHSKEKAFRDWYVALVQNFQWTADIEYVRYLRALQVPEEVRGFREVRYSKMDDARRRALSYLSGHDDHSGAMHDELQIFESIS